MSRILKCPLCCQAHFESKKELRKHLTDVTSQLNNLHCSLCDQQFLTVLELIEHLKTECVNEKGEPLKPSNRHVCFVDCSVFSKSTMSSTAKPPVLELIPGERREVISIPLKPRLLPTTIKKSRSRVKIQVSQGDSPDKCAPFEAPIAPDIRTEIKQEMADPPSPHNGSDHDVYEENNVIEEPVTDDFILKEYLTSNAKLPIHNTSRVAMEMKFGAAFNKQTEPADLRTSTNSRNVEVSNTKAAHIPVPIKDWKKIVRYVPLVSNEKKCEETKTPIGSDPFPLISDEKKHLDTKARIKELEELLSSSKQNRSARKLVTQEGSYIASESGASQIPNAGQSYVRKKREPRTYISDKEDAMQGLQVNFNTTGNYINCTFCTEEFDDLTVAKAHVQQVHWGNELLTQTTNYTNKKGKVTTRTRKIHILHSRPGATNTTGLEQVLSMEQIVSAGIPLADLRYKCSCCKLVFETTEAANEHECVLPCPLCDKVLNTTQALQYHTNRHTRNDLEAELNNFNVTSQETARCDPCRANIHPELEEIHRKIHRQGYLIHKCEDCKYLAISKATLATHRKLQHKPVVIKIPRIFKCEHCSEYFSTLVDMRKHVRFVHIQEPVYKCSYCDKIMKRKWDVIKHERVHTGEKPKSCTICDKKFRVSSTLTLHMRTHTNERPYQCTKCDKSFKAYTALSLHQKAAHSDVRAYKCPCCEYRCKTLTALHGHKNTHQKPFKCQHCDRQFASRHSLKKHEFKMHTSGKERTVYDCIICGASYGRGWALEIHLKTHGQLANTDMLKSIVDIGKKIKDEPESPDTPPPPPTPPPRAEPRPTRKRKQTKRYS